MSSRPTPPWKQIIIGVLEQLASETDQLDYERNVPHVDITAELLCRWFDDSYHPNDPGFRSCFTEAELLAMSEFDTFYSERTGLLPKSNGTVRTWLASPVWREVMHQASQTLGRVAA
jgi:hypothetical protein